jgi:hypothetical protein
VAIVGSRITATRVTLGAISFRSWSHFAASAYHDHEIDLVGLGGLHALNAVLNCSSGMLRYLRKSRTAG